MRTIEVRQIDLKDKCKHIAIHSFPFPEYLDKGFYRTVTSYSAFFHSMKRRNNSGDYLFLVIDTQYPKTDYEVKRDAQLPIIHHDNILEFFKSIGYDRETKKYLKI